MHVWHIRLLGELGISRNGESFARFSTRKTGALLAYLALHTGQRHTRDTLCDMLWSEELPQTSRARLRVALTTLRQQLEPPGIASGSVLRTYGHDQLEFASGAVVTDVAEIEQALQILATADALESRIVAGERIVALSAEPLLAGFNEDWVIAERERLSQVIVERLLVLAQQVSAERGIRFAEHATLLQSTAEEPLFVLFPLLAANGRREEITRIFQAFCRRTRNAQGIAPSNALQELVAALQHGQELPVPLALTTTTVMLAPMPVPVLLQRRVPSYLSRFFGRESEIEELYQILEDTTLVTMTGPGGTGKTRLSVEVARAWSGDSYFVPLADITEPNRIPAAICDAVGETRKGTEDSAHALLLQIGAVLSKKTKPLLVLDNLEQVADAAGSVLLKLMEHVPTARFLLTSRLRVHLPGEWEFVLSPLPLPEHETAKRREEAAHVPSVALFVDRAQASRPDFQITAHNCRDIVAICRMLEGNPLAIELVAARNGTLVPAQMRQELARRGNLLIANKRAGHDDRHRSLYAAIDWSYQLLPPELRSLFAFLSVFRGSFTVPAVATVVDSDDMVATSEAIHRLRSHSLVAGVDGDHEIRFALLESLRAFGAEQLADEEQETASERHAAWFAEVAEDFYGDHDGSAQAKRLERIEADMLNFHTAMEHDHQKNPRRAVQIAGALAIHWNLRGRPTEGRYWLEQSLAAWSESDDELDKTGWEYRGRALHGAGVLAQLQGNGAAAQAFFDRSLALRYRSGDKFAIAITLNSLGLLSLSRQDWDQARTFLSESLAIRREIGDTMEIAGSLMNLGVVEWERGDFAATRRLNEEVLTRTRQQGDKVVESRALNNLGGVALALGDFATAESYYEQSLVIKRMIGNPPGIAMTLANVGIAAMYQGHYVAAVNHLEEAVAMYREINSWDNIAHTLCNLGQAVLYHGDQAQALIHLKESLRMMRESDTPTDVAGNLEGLALYAGMRALHETATRLLGTADALRIRTDCPLYPAERVAVDKVAENAKTALGQERFHAIFQEGADAPLEEAITVAFSLAH